MGGQQQDANWEKYAESGNVQPTVPAPARAITITNTTPVGNILAEAEIALDGLSTRVQKVTRWESIEGTDLGLEVTAELEAAFQQKISAATN